MQRMYAVTNGEAITRPFMKMNLQKIQGNLQNHETEAIV